MPPQRGNLFPMTSIPWADAKRRSPKGSRMRRHRQRQADSGNATRRRLKSRVLKICGWYVVFGPKRIVVNARLACRSDWASSKAWLARVKVVAEFLRKVWWDEWAAWRCQPWPRAWSESSCGGGLAPPAASSFQLGGSKPKRWSCCCVCSDGL